MKVDRNEPCPCGSGKKYKSCCKVKGTRTEREWTLLWVILGVLLAGGAVAALHQQSKQERRPAPQRVWSEEHGHWHDAPATPADTSLPE